MDLPIILWFLQPNAETYFVNMETAGDCRVVNLSSLLTSGKFSDLRLVCEGREFSVHKAVLCSQSRVINAACEGNFEVRIAIPRCKV